MVNVSTERTHSSQYVVEIQVEPDRVERSLTSAARRVANQVNIPGFRRGKAPRHVVERFVGRETLLKEAIERLVSDLYKEAIDEAGISPVSDPEIELDPPATEIKAGDTLVVKATIPVAPIVQLGDYRSIRAPALEVDVSDHEVDELIERVQEQNAQLVAVERPAAKGDRIIADVREQVGSYTRLYSPSGEPLVTSGGGQIVNDDQNVEIVLGDEADERYSTDFTKNIEGMEAGQEKHFEISLPADHPDRELASKLASFRVKVQEVNEKRLPSVDDELARMMGIDSVEELRNALRAQAQARAEYQAQRIRQELVMKQLSDMSTVEIAPLLVERQVNRYMERLTERLQQRGETLAEHLKETGRTEEQALEGMRAEALENLRTALLLQDLAELEGISVTEEDVMHEIEASFLSFGPGAARFTDRLNKPDEIEFFRQRALTSRVIARLLQIAQGDTEEAASSDEIPSGESEPAQAADEQSLIGEVSADAASSETGEGRADEPSAEAGGSETADDSTDIADTVTDELTDREMEPTVDEVQDERSETQADDDRAASGAGLD